MTHQNHTIAIAGAGIMGLMSAYVLTRAGHAVTLYDPSGFPASNASAMAGGMLAPYSEVEHMDGAWIEAGLTGIQAWQDFDGGNIGFEHNGSLLIAHEDDQYILERFKSHLPTDKASMRAVGAMEVQLGSKFSHGVFLEDEAHLDPAAVMAALCQTKAEYKQEAADIETLARSHEYVIDCRGMGAADNEPTLRGVKGEIAIVRNAEFTLQRPVRLMHPRYPLYIVPRADNLFMIGATVIEAEDEQVSVRSGLELLSALYSLHPSFGEAQILDVRAGVRPSYPDNLPRIKTNGNIISCNGLFRHGYLLSPVIAECVAEHIAGRTHKFWDLMTGQNTTKEGGHNEADNQRRSQKLRGTA